MKRYNELYRILKKSTSLYGHEKASREGARRSIYPSQEFQEKYSNLFSENIYEIYRMPTGYSDEYNANDQLSRVSDEENYNAGSKFERFDVAALRVIFDELVSKNKSLKIFKSHMGDTYKMYTVFAGACSRFLADDIEFFINNASEDFEQTDYHNRMLNASKKLNLKFVPSEQTLRTIIDSLSKEPGLIESLIN